jgi:hypothetical protein
VAPAYPHRDCGSWMQANMYTGLLEQKGLKTPSKDEASAKEGSPAPSSARGASSVSSTPTKRSMSMRIKNKLHIGRKDKDKEKE